MNRPEIVFCHPVRAAIGAYNGALKDIAAPDLGAAVIRAEGSRPARIGVGLLDGDSRRGL